MRLFTPLRTTLAAALLAATGAALAQQPAAPGAGLPMWVIRDADSTIYLTGTVHLLPDNVAWRSAKLEGAIQQSSELYLELDRSENRSISLGHCVAERWQTITDALGYDADLSEMVRYFEEHAGVEVHGRRDVMQTSSDLNSVQSGKIQ